MLFTSVVFFLINCILDILFIIAFPLLSLILKHPASFERLALCPPVLKKPIWIHAASVGEVNAILPMIKELEKTGRDILITTTSVTGWQRVKESDLNVSRHLLPLDVRIVMSSFIRRIDPCMILIVETEIWPNLLYSAIRKQIPVGWINARISKGTLTTFKTLSCVFKPLFKRITFVNAQTGVDKHRFNKIGFRNVQIAGNLKFCLNLPSYNYEQSKCKYGIKDHDFVIVWGSSRPGEEKLFVDLIPTLNKAIPNLKNVIVPRHLNRMEEITKIMGPIPFALFSKDKSCNYTNVIVDKMGVLNELYSVCNIAIVGGSFTDFGGHNPLEPAYYKKPIIIGPFHNSCRGSVKALARKKAIVISDSDKLLDDIIRLYNDRELRDSMGANAKKTLNENSNALDYSVDAVKALIC